MPKPSLIEENPVLSINVKLWKFLSVILKHNWHVYVFVAPVCLMNVLQFVYLYRVSDDLAPFILNMFFASAIFDALLRTCLVIYNRNKFEAFMLELAKMYQEIEESNDAFAKGILKEVVTATRRISIFNLTASFCDIVGALLYPLFSENRVHPFGVAVPSVNMTQTPVYEIFYILQLPTPVILTAMYMPFVNLFGAFAMFGKATLTILQHNLKQICKDNEKSEHQMYEDLIACILYYKRIARYVKDFNSLVTYIVSVEFLLFNCILCSLLFCINIIKSATQIVSVIMYIFTMLYVLFTYYWYANELLVESLKVSESVFSMQWYNADKRFKSTVLIFGALTQKPLRLMVGNVYPMTLETFQSLLNASYSYFSVLRGVYN
ncbi:odorant receptor 43a [Teleopsis dalmanni]|uniref:odorant receptor 43a n=1 Tax=Teleopsis dalmanni TaxID=139649 RepID=UPI0018CE86B7|nr:odorant receptor 43a [Teleopsis dalmanni]